MATLGMIIEMFLTVILGAVLMIVGCILIRIGVTPIGIILAVASCIPVLMIVSIVDNLASS